jgi:type II secretory pathway pseudopilin PulG
MNNNLKLGTCPFCGSQVNSAAQVCPHCGQDLKKRRQPVPPALIAVGSVLLVIILGTIAYAAMVRIPRVQAQRARAQETQCRENLEVIKTALENWAKDHGTNYPFNLSTNSGGTLEFCARDANGADTNSLFHFLALSKEIFAPRVLTCPSTGRGATNWASLKYADITYHLHTASHAAHGGFAKAAVLVFCPAHHLSMSFFITPTKKTEAEEEAEALVKEHRQEMEDRKRQEEDQKWKDLREQARQEMERAREEQMFRSKVTAIRYGLPNTWSFKSGTTFKGDFHAIRDTNLVLRLTGFKETGPYTNFYKIPISALSESDQKLVEALAKPEP